MTIRNRIGGGVRLNAAMRATRAAAAPRINDIAATCNVDADALRHRLRHLNSRGGCARTLTAATQAQDPAIQRFALDHSNCPPPAKRLAENADVRFDGVTGWAHPPPTSAKVSESRTVTIAGGPRSHIAAAAERSTGTVCEAAANPMSPAGLLTILAADTDREIRAEVAANPSCGSQLITQLATDPDELVRNAVAANPSSGPHIVALLAEDPDDYVRQGLTRNPGCGETVLKRLSGDPSAFVRAGVAAHPQCPSDTLRALAADLHLDVVEKAVFSPALFTPTAKRSCCDASPPTKTHRRAPWSPVIGHAHKQRCSISQRTPTPRCAAKPNTG